ncbi:MAG: thioredoxin family protein [Candidatus Saganbacteria bacterium]|nr:thioredoxin family protein [Candidatus Saganbacteria bacterium]
MADLPDKCELIKKESDLYKAIKSKKELFALFYASWCPYSQAFLPKFIESADRNNECHVRIVIDDKDTLLDKYKIEVFPTVLFFRNGKVTERLDSIPHEGLNSSKLEKFIGLCKRK